MVGPKHVPEARCLTLALGKDASKMVDPDRKWTTPSSMEPGQGAPPMPDCEGLLACPCIDAAGTRMSLPFPPPRIECQMKYTAGLSVGRVSICRWSKHRGKHRKSFYM
jgi:hypothetical protein